VDRIVQALRPYQPQRIHLFGSAARGECDELSDVDLVIIKETERPFLDRLSEVAALLPPDVGGVDLLVYTPAEFSEMAARGNAFVEMVLEEGRVIYDGQADV
jgi:predicted nucleotidyltransferase